MNRKATTNNWATEVRVIAGRYAVADIDQCVTLALVNKPNTCLAGKATEEIISVLAKASYIRTQLDEGKTLSTSMCELYRRLRSLQTVINNE